MQASQSPEGALLNTLVAERTLSFSHTPVTSRAFPSLSGAFCLPRSERRASSKTPASQRLLPIVAPPYVVQLPMGTGQPLRREQVLVLRVRRLQSPVQSTSTLGFWEHWLDFALPGSRWARSTARTRR